MPARIRDELRRLPPELFISITPMVAAFGAAFGVAAAAAGMPAHLATVMSGTTFAGSAQFTLVAILGQSGSLVAALVAGIAVNARYLPMGAAIAPKLPGSSWRRFVQAQLMIDESWALAHTATGFDRRRLLATGVVLWFVWVGSTWVGASAGSTVTPEALGLDAGIAALFAALLLPRLRCAASYRTAAIAVLSTGVALVVLPAGVAILVGAAAALVGADHE